MRNVLTVLAAAGTAEHVVKLNIYLVNGVDTQVGYAASRSVGNHRTAITVVSPQDTLRPGALVEIDAVAIIPEVGSNGRPGWGVTEDMLDRGSKLCARLGTLRPLWTQFDVQRRVVGNQPALHGSAESRSRQACTRPSECTAVLATVRMRC